MSNKLIFIHIPKTAGTSTRVVLAGHFPPDRVLPVTGHPVPSQGLRARREYDFISDHQGADVWNFIGDGYTAFTVIREPMSRVVSLYNMYRAATKQGMTEAPPPLREVQSLAKRLDLLEFLRCDNPVVRRNTNNGQVRQLASDLADESDRSRSLELATANLERIDVVGVTEMLRSSLVLLFHRMGWPGPVEPPTLGRVKPSVTLDTLDDETRAELDRVTRLDQRLYRTALRRLDRDLTEFREAAHEPPIAPATHEGPCTITMDGPSPGKGWHVREGPPDRPVRWTGPDCESAVTLALRPGQPYLLDLRLAGVMAQDIFDGMTIEANSVRCPWWSRIETPGEIIVEAKIPAEGVGPGGSTTLRLGLPRTVSHHQLNPQIHDDRPKGVAVTRLTLTPVQP